MPSNTLLARYPITIYLALCFGWSWGVWSLLLLLIGHGGLTQSPPTAAFVIAGLGAIGPSLAGLIATRWLYGAAGLRQLLARLRIWRVGRWGWVLLVIPATTALTPLLRGLTGHPVNVHSMIASLGPGIALGIFAGCTEEFGWRGFLLPHLLKRYSPLLATLYVGAIWGALWHGYADYFGVPGDGVSFWLLIALLGPGLLTAWSLILTRVYQCTQTSLLMSILTHASISSSALVFSTQYASVEEELAWTALSVLLAWIAALVLWLATRDAARG